MKNKNITRMNHPVSVTEANNIIDSSLKQIGTEYLKIEEVNQKLLQEDIILDRDQPPFNRVAMDGIAIKHKTLEDNLKKIYTIQTRQYAGEVHKQLKSESHCIEIMTGSVLPLGCDCVIPYEELEIKENIAKIISKKKNNLMQNIHEKGSDYIAGTKIIEKDSLLNPTHISVLATVGKSKILVNKQPKIILFSTGNELIPIQNKPKNYQVRTSSIYSIEAALHRHGFTNITKQHMKDSKRDITEKLNQATGHFDVYILSGGVSKGRYDFIPDVLDNIKIKQLFHGVNMKPGKPLWFGMTTNNNPMFALPGNPVSTLICFYRFVLSALKKMTGLEQVITSKVFVSKINQKQLKNKSFTYFLPIKIKNIKDTYRTGEELHINGSGDYISLIKSDGFIELNNAKDLNPQNLYPFYPW